MASLGGEYTYSGFHTGGNARVHAGDSYNNHTYNYTLRQRRSDETLRGSERHKVFIQAVVEGQLPRIRNFLRMGVDLDDTGSSDLTALHRAVLSGHQDVIEPLIEAGADVNAMSDDFGTPLCLAALKGMHGVIQLLLRYRAKVRTMTKKVGTALHCCVASTGDQKPTITTLLQAGANTAAQSTIDIQWLHAVREWDGDDRNQIGSSLHVKAGVLHDTTPAFVAVQLAHIGLLELLLPLDLDNVFRVGVPELEAVDGSIPPPIRTSTSGLQNETDDSSLPVLLHTYTSGCARTGDLAGVEYLIAKGAKIDLHDNAAATPLMVAAGQGHMAIATLLLDHGASIDTRIGRGLTALHCAVSRNRIEMVRMLCERGASTDIKDKNGCTPLSYATCNRDRPDLVEALCEHGATVDIKGSMGYTDLHSAASEGYDKIVRALCEHGANVDAKADDDSTPLLLAVAAGHADTVRLLCERGATVNMMSTLGNTPLHVARNHRIIQTLCEYGASPDTEDINGKTPFWTTASLLANQKTDSHEVETWKCFQELINAGCDINSRDSSGHTPLLRILEGSGKIDTALVEKLIRAGADTRLRADDGTSVLHLCTSNRAYGRLLQAIGRGLGVNAEIVAMFGCHVAFIRPFLSIAWEFLLVHICVRDGLEDFSFLCLLGSDIDITDSAGWTALHLAASEGDILAIDKLLAAGASIDVYSAQEGRSPLGVAIHYHKLEAARLLYRYGSNPHAKGPGPEAESALDVANRGGGGEMLELLRSATARTPAIDPTSAARAKLQSATIRITESYVNEQRLSPSLRPPFRAPPDEPPRQQEQLRLATRQRVTPPRAAGRARRSAHVKYPLQD